MCTNCDENLGIPVGATGPIGPQGPMGNPGTNGTNGLSIIWQGNLAAPPVTPIVNWAYYDIVLLRSRIWNGTTWQILAIDGVNGGVGSVGPAGPTGATGATGVQGPQGVIGLTGVAGPIGPVGTPGFIYETVDTNGTAATSVLHNEMLRRNYKNDGYEFVNFSQILADIQFNTNNLGFNTF